MVKRVSIVAMGDSRNDYLAGKLTMETADLLNDGEVWGINFIGCVMHCDRVIAMDSFDDPACFEKYPKGHLEVLKKTQVPIYTCKHVEGLNTVLFPYAEIVKKFGGFTYFNTTVAYAIVLAIHEGAKEIMLFGCDFTYPDRHASESGRACCEFWLGIAMAMGVKITVASSSTLLDQNTSRRPYGYSPDGEGYMGVTDAPT